MLIHKNSSKMLIIGSTETVELRKNGCLGIVVNCLEKIQAIFLIYLTFPLKNNILNKLKFVVLN